MSTRKYLEDMQELQYYILEFIEKEEKSKENFNKILEIIESQKIKSKKYKLQSFLSLVVKIANNYHRTSDFFHKIHKIIKEFKKEILQFFSNSDLFKIFHSNKRVLLSLIQLQVFKIDEDIYSKMRIYEEKYKNSKYAEYFFPEIEDFLDEETANLISSEIPDDFDGKREIGENDDILCKLIRQDSVEKLDSYIKENNIPLTTLITPSIFETNPYLIKNQPTLIEYSAFYGSIKTINYLIRNKVSIPQSLWLYSVHSQNYEAFKLLKKNHIKPQNTSYIDVMNESIKCHFNSFFREVESEYLPKDQKSHNFNTKSLKYYNYQLMDAESINVNSFVHLCKYNYYSLVKKLLDKGEVDVNLEKIKI